MIDDFQMTDFAGATPVITTSGALSAVNTTYGTPSASPTSFTVSGADMTAGILVTPPAGFEVSKTSISSGYVGSGTAITVGGAGTIASTAVYVRLAATAGVGASPYSGNIVCSSSGATPKNVATVSSTVSPAPLTITGLTGSNKFYDGTTAAAFTGTAAYSGLQNSESFSVSGTPSASFSTAGAGNGKTITVSGYTAPSVNYSLTQPTLSADITPAPLTITADDVVKAEGDTLTGGAGSTAFTSDGLTNSEAIGSVTITYGTGAAPGDTAGTYTDQVTPSDATGGTFSGANYAITYVPGDITVTVDPTITVSGTPSAVDTTYGTASPTPTSFTVSGVFLSGDLTITPPSGFEVSTNIGSDYSTGLILPASGTLEETLVYVRLAATATVAGSPYSGDVTITGGGATGQTIATASSAVAPKELTITGLTGDNKIYDRTTDATVSGTAVLNGIVAGDEDPLVTLDGTPVASFETFTADTGKPITVTGYSISGTASGNYTLTQPTGLTGDITPLELTVTGETVDTKPYDGTTTATISGATLVGVIDPDVVTVGGGGTFADANVDTGIAVTAELTLGGADAGNYSLAQPVGLTGDITPASQTITFAPLLDKISTDDPFALTATASSGLAVTYTSDTPLVATVSGDTVTIVGVGTTTITASQAGNGSYNAATDVTRTLTVSAPLLAGWEILNVNSSASPVLAPDNQDPNIVVGGLTLGSGVGATTTPNTWGGNNWDTKTDAAGAIAGGDYVTFTITASTGFRVSFSSIPAYNIRRSGTGPTTGIWQFKVGAGAFTDIGSAITWGSGTSSSGNLQSAIDLSGISALQNLAAGTTVTFRIVNWGDTGTGGTWYINNFQTGDDFKITGTIVPNQVPVANPDTYTNLATLLLKIPIASLTSNDADADGDPITLTGINLTTTNGVVMVTNSTYIFYTNALNVPDEFTYTISDGSGGSATGTVSIVVLTSVAGQATGIISTGGSDVTVGFAGRPTWSYGVQRSTNMVDWTTIWTTNAPVSGLFQYTDKFTDLGYTPPSAYYRLSWTP